MSVQNSSKDLYYTDTDRKDQLGVATESEEASMDPVWNEDFSQILYISIIVVNEKNTNLKSKLTTAKCFRTDIFFES